MGEQDWLAARFEEHRSHLKAVAQRMLGSPAEAEDALQETWLRLSRTEAPEIENLGGWLTTVVSRVCLDSLRSRRLRNAPEEKLPNTDEPASPDRDLLLADSVGAALFVVLDALEPAERVAFVLHDMFDMTFDEIAPIVGRSSVAARQLASRARRRIQGRRDSEGTAQSGVVKAFLSAARDGNFEALLSALDPNVVLRADAAAIQLAAAVRWGGSSELPSEVHGTQAVAATLRGRAYGVQPALIDGSPGAVWMLNGKVKAAWLFTIEAGKIVEIDMRLDSDALDQLNVTVEA